MYSYRKTLSSFFLILTFCSKILKLWMSNTKRKTLWKKSKTRNNNSWIFRRRDFCLCSGGDSIWRMIWYPTKNCWLWISRNYPWILSIMQRSLWKWRLRSARISLGKMQISLSASRMCGTMSVSCENVFNALNRKNFYSFYFF